MQPGEAILTGQVDGQQLGNAIFQALPCLPHEGPPGMPRALAKRLFPQGFIPGAIRPAATMVEQLVLVPAAGMAAPPAPPNQVVAPQVQATPEVPMVSQPAQYGYRSVQSGGDPIRPIAQRHHIVERKGL